jgi:membrane protein implicated in regulation of membrane protease activity
MVWLLVGSALCILEVLIPIDFTPLMMGLCAFLVALIALVIPQWTGLQIFLWIALSISSIILVYRFLPNRTSTKILDRTCGEAITEILPGKTGRVLYEGGSWKARCGDDITAIAPGESVYVIGREGTTLLVMPNSILEES